MAKNFDYRLIVVGGGVAGVAAALVAAAIYKEPRQVALISPQHTLDTAAGKVYNPYGAMQECAFAASRQFLHSHARAFDAQNPKILRAEWNQSLSAWQRKVEPLRRALADRLSNAEVDIIQGSARFLNAYEVVVAPSAQGTERRLSAPKLILTTGTQVNFGKIKLAKQLRFLTPFNFYTALPPATVCVVGGGATGCAIAQYFANFGSKVLLLEQKNRLLPGEDPEASLAVTTFLQHHTQAKVLTDAKVLAASENNGQRRLLVKLHGQEKTIGCEAVVFATGFAPALPGLVDNVNVASSSSGIKTDRSLQTTCRHIWAAGGCVNPGCSPEQAAYAGDLAASNASGRNRDLVSLAGFSHLVQTTPQIARVGMTENECLDAGIRNYRKATVLIKQTLAASVEAQKTGFVKILCDRFGTLLGATVVAPNAAEIIQEIAFALRHELTCIELASTPHSAFTYGAAIQLCAKKLAQSLKEK